MAGRAATYARDRAEMERTVAIAKQTAKDAARGMQAVAGTAATAAGAAARTVKQGALRGLDATRGAIEKGEEAIGAARQTYERVKPELRLRYANARLVLARYKRDAARVLYGTPGRPAVPRSRFLPLGNIEEAVPAVEGLVPKAYRFMRRGRDIAEHGAERVGDVVRQNREVMQRFFAERRMLAEHARLMRERNLDALIRTTNMAAPVPLPGPAVVLPQPIIAPLPAAAGALAPAAPLAAPMAPLAAAAAPAHLEAMDNAQLLAHVQALQQQLQNPVLGAAGPAGQ